MILNHINLTVTDVPATQAFLQTYFGLRSTSANRNLAVLVDDGGLILTLTSMKLGGETEVRYPANFHIGFAQGSSAQVDEIHRRLAADGYTPPLPSSQHGSWTFYFDAPGGFTIEVLGPLPDVPSPGGGRSEVSSS